MERKIEGKTEKEFLEWLYQVIGDDEVDYMWSISGRLGELRAIESKERMIDARKGCGARTQIYPKLAHVFSICGDERFHEEDDEPNLCKLCREKFNILLKEYQGWNPKYKLKEKD